MDFYDRMPDPSVEPVPATPSESEDADHGWLYEHRGSVCLTVLVSWLSLVALSASIGVGGESVGVGMALFMGSVLFLFFGLSAASVLSLIGSPPLVPEDAAVAVERTEEALSARVPFRFLRRWFGRGVGTFGYPFGIAALLLIASGLGLFPAPEEEQLAFKIGLGALVGSIALTVLVGVTSYPSFLLPQSYRALYGRRTWIDRLRGPDGERRKPATAWTSRRP